MITAYKLFDLGPNGEPKTLFHGLNGSKTLPIGEWLEADVKEVTDGDPRTATKYLSGWHCMANTEELKDYHSRFKRRRPMGIFKVSITRDNWRKTHSPHVVILARHMKVEELVEPIWTGI